MGNAVTLYNIEPQCPRHQGSERGGPQDLSIPEMIVTKNNQHEGILSDRRTVTYVVGSHRQDRPSLIVALRRQPEDLQIDSSVEGSFCAGSGRCPGAE